MNKVLVVIAILVTTATAAMAQRIIRFDGSKVQLETGQWLDVSGVPRWSRMRVGHDINLEVQRCRKIDAEECWNTYQRDMAELNSVSVGGYGGYGSYGGYGGMYSVNVGGVMVSGGYGQTTIGVATKHGGAMVSLPSSVFSKQKKSDAKAAAKSYAAKRNAGQTKSSVKAASVSSRNTTTTTTTNSLLVW